MFLHCYLPDLLTFALSVNCRGTTRRRLSYAVINASCPLVGKFVLDIKIATLQKQESLSQKP